MEVRGGGVRTFGDGGGEKPTGGGKGTGKDGAKQSGQSQKIQGQCWNDWKIRSSTAITAASQNQGQTHSSWKGKDVKGKSGKGGEKKSKSKDAGALAWTQLLM